MIYRLIFNNLDINNRIKIIKISKYLGYYILTNIDLWNNIEIYNLKGYKYIFNFIKIINNNPTKILCISSGKININLDKYLLDKLEYLNLSNSKITYNNLIKILYRCKKLKKLYLKRLNLHSLVRHIINNQKETIEELDISISKKFTYSFTNYNLNNIYELNNLKVLKINNNSIAFEIFINILKIKKLKILEIKDVLINKKPHYCICSYNIEEIISLLNNLEKVSMTHITFCTYAIKTFKIKLKYNLII